MKTYALLGVLLVILLAPQASATSFIPECQYNEYRTNQSDVVFTGEVSGITEILVEGTFGQRAYTEIRFNIINSTKGSVTDTFTLTQPSHLSGEAIIPGMTLDWEETDVYTIQARQSSQGYQLVCGGYGRQLIENQQEVEQEPTPQPTIWQKIRNWLTSWL